MLWMEQNYTFKALKEKDNKKNKKKSIMKILKRKETELRHIESFLLLLYFNCLEFKDINKLLGILQLKRKLFKMKLLII